MILAAGLGLRLRPLTDDRPKAMITVAGRPLISHLLDKLEDAGVEKIVVNLHYKPEPLVAYLKGHPLAGKIIFSDEREKILETGGGVKAALPHFSDEPFFVINCDAFFPESRDNPFLTLKQAWGNEKMAALLLLKAKEQAIGYDGPGDFFRQSGGRLRRRGEAREAPYAFTGVQILTQELFENLSDAVFSLNKIYDRALSQNALFGVPYGSAWLHMGTPDTVEQAEGFHRQ
jgi:MurNAc alpha-1-phosphate uridylyltransferase